MERPADDDRQGAWPRRAGPEARRPGQRQVRRGQAAHPEFAGKKLVSDFTSEPNAHYVIGKGDPRNAIFDGLGLDTGGTIGDVSEEKLNLLDGEALFVNGLGKEQLADVPAFQRLNVVRDGRTLYAGSDSTLSGAIAFHGPNAMMYALDLLVPPAVQRLHG